MDLISKIRSNYSALSKNHRKVADYLVTHEVEAAFDSIMEVARKVRVSEASVVRFAKQLGFKGYPSFRREFQAEIKKASGSAFRFRDALTGVADQSFFESLFQHDIQLIAETKASLSEETFSRAVTMILRADKILIIGFRAAFSLAYFLYFRFARLRLDARLVTLTGGTSLVEQLALLEKNDLVIALGFDETPRETKITVNFAKKHGIPILGITHIPTSEIARAASVFLLGRRQPHRTQSLAASMSLLNALAIAVAARHKVKAMRALRRLDTIEQEYLKGGG